MNKRTLQNSEEEPIRVRNGPSGNRLALESPYRLLQPLYLKNAMFHVPAYSSKQTPRKGRAANKCCSITWPTRTYLRTYRPRMEAIMQALSTTIGNHKPHLPKPPHP